MDSSYRDDNSSYHNGHCNDHDALAVKLRVTFTLTEAKCAAAILFLLNENEYSGHTHGQASIAKCVLGPVPLLAVKADQPVGPTFWVVDRASE